MNFKVVFTLSNLCTLSLAQIGPSQGACKPTDTTRTLACISQCQHTEIGSVLNTMDRVQNATKTECRSRQFNEKSGRHHAQHRCYLVD